MKKARKNDGKDDIFYLRLYIKQILQHQIEINESIRDLCKIPFSEYKNGCPNYKNCWSCPPFSLSSQVLIINLSKFNYFYIAFSELRLDILAQKLRENHSCWSEKQIYNSRYYSKTIYNKLNNFLDSVSTKFPNTYILSGSSCKICKNGHYHGCTCPNDRCRFPERMRYSMESVGINVFKTLENIGVILEKTPRKLVRQVGLICSSIQLDLSPLETGITNAGYRGFTSQNVRI